MKISRKTRQECNMNMNFTQHHKIYSGILVCNSDYNIKKRWSWIDSSAEKNYWDDLKNGKPPIQRKTKEYTNTIEQLLYQEGKQLISEENAVGAGTNKYKLATSKHRL